MWMGQVWNRILVHHVKDHTSINGHGKLEARIRLARFMGLYGGLVSCSGRVPINCTYWSRSSSHQHMCNDDLYTTVRKMNYAKEYERREGAMCLKLHRQHNCNSLGLQSVLSQFASAINTCIFASVRWNRGKYNHQEFNPGPLGWAHVILHATPGTYWVATRWNIQYLLCRHL